MLSSSAIIVLAALLTDSSSAQVSVAFPLNSQFPPVAVVDKEFIFTFSPDTFSTPIPGLKYDLKKAPSWLRLNGDTRTLSGVPLTADIGKVQIGLQASAESVTTIAAATLLVLEENTLSGNYEALTSQLTAAGSFSPPSTLLLHPSNSFKINLASALFHGVDKNTNYYVLSAGNTPLPAWVSYDSDTLLFSGTTPTLLTPQASPETYYFVIIASNAAGFSQASLSFEISVTNHILAFKQPLQVISLLANTAVRVPSLLNHLYRDNSLISREAVNSISTNQPEWLILNKSDLSFSGLSPSYINDTFFPVDVVDDQDNLASAVVWLLTLDQSVGYEVETYLGSVTCERGEEFRYDLPSFEAWQFGYNYTADLGNATSWLSFDSSSMVLNGVVPFEAPLTHFNVSLSLLAKDDPVQVSYLETVVADNVVTIPSQTGQASSRHTLSPTVGGKPASSQTMQPNDSKRHSKRLALAISLPLSLTIGIVALGYLLFTKFKIIRKQTSQISAGSVGPRHDQRAVVLVKGQTQPKFDTVSKNLFVSSRVESSRDLLQPFHEEGLPVNARGIACNPEAMSSWDEILTDLELPDRIAKFAKLPKITPAADGYLGLETDVPCASLYPVTLRKSENRTSLKSHVTRRDILEPRSSDAQRTGRRSSGLGHGVILPSMLGHDLNLVSFPQQHHVENETFISKRFSLPTSTPNSNKCCVFTSATSLSTNEVYKQKASLSSTSSSCEDESECNHQFKYSDGWSQLGTIPQLASEGHIDCEWITETGTVRSFDESFGQERYLRTSPKAERQRDRLDINSRQIQCPEGIDVESQRSELSQTHSLRFL